MRCDERCELQWSMLSLTSMNKSECLSSMVVQAVYLTNTCALLYFCYVLFMMMGSTPMLPTSKAAQKTGRYWPNCFANICLWSTQKILDDSSSRLYQKNSRRLWRSRKRKSSSVPEGAANFPAAIFLAGKCPNPDKDSISCCRKIGEEFSSSVEICRKTFPAGNFGQPQPSRVF